MESSVTGSGDRSDTVIGSEPRSSPIVLVVGPDGDVPDWRTEVALSVRRLTGGIGLQVKPVSLWNGPLGDLRASEFAKAVAIAFLFPRHPTGEQLPFLFIEFGYWLAREPRKIVCGVDPAYAAGDTVRFWAERSGVHCHSQPQQVAGELYAKVWDGICE